MSNETTVDVNVNMKSIDEALVKASLLVEKIKEAKSLAEELASFEIDLSVKI